jgi:hypothetical protein
MFMANFLEVPFQVYTAIVGGEVEMFIVAGLFLSGLSGLFSLFMQFRMDSWPTTSGILLQSGTTELGASAVKADRQIMHKLLYEYQVNGVSYTGNQLSPWKESGRQFSGAFGAHSASSRYR